MQFPKRLIDLRESKDLRQNELAEAVGIQPNNISKYEKGISQPTIATLIKFSEFFSVSMDYLLGISSIKNPYSADKFTPKEAEIIAKYRKLSPENRIRIDERIGAMIDGQHKDLA